MLLRIFKLKVIIFSQYVNMPQPIVTCGQSLCATAAAGYLKSRWMHPGLNFCSDWRGQAPISHIITTPAASDQYRNII